MTYCTKVVTVEAEPVTALGQALYVASVNGKLHVFADEAWRSLFEAVPEAVSALTEAAPMEPWGATESQAANTAQHWWNCECGLPPCEHIWAEINHLQAELADAKAAVQLCANKSLLGKEYIRLAKQTRVLVGFIKQLNRAVIPSEVAEIINAVSPSSLRDDAAKPSQEAL